MQRGSTERFLRSSSEDEVWVENRRDELQGFLVAVSDVLSLECEVVHHVQGFDGYDDRSEHPVGLACGHDIPPAERRAIVATTTIVYT